MTGGVKKGRIHKTKKHEFPTPKSDINVTPLVDVCLVLLIIFMVITPLMSRGREVPLPKTEFHYNRKDKLQPVVAIDTEGIVWVEKERLGEPTKETLELMKTKISEGWEKVTDANSMGRVYLKAARDLPYGKVYPVLIAINDLGVMSVDLGTNEREAK